SVALRADPLIAAERAVPGELVLLALLVATAYASMLLLSNASRTIHALAGVMQPRAPRLLRSLIDRDDRRIHDVVVVLVMAAFLPIATLDAAALVATFFTLLLFMGMNGLVALEQTLDSIAFRARQTSHRLAPL